VTFFDFIGGAASDLFDAKGYKEAAKGYEGASRISKENAKLSSFATGIKLVQHRRDAYRTTSGQRADIAGAGFANTGSALDLMRSSAADAALDQSIINIQGTIEKNDFVAQGKLYDAQAEQAEVKEKGSIFGAVLKGAAAIGSLFLSDRSMKEDIRQIGVADNGLPIYAYRVKGEKGTRLGFMADEVEKLHPGAVKTVAGVKMVDYEKAVQRG
jgi:hypothetical protein